MLEARDGRRVRRRNDAYRRYQWNVNFALADFWTGNGVLCLARQQYMHSKLSFCVYIY